MQSERMRQVYVKSGMKMRAADKFHLNGPDGAQGP